MRRATRRCEQRPYWLRTTSKVIDFRGRRLQKPAPPDSFSAMLKLRTCAKVCATLIVAVVAAATLIAQAPASQAIAIRAGSLLDPEAGRLLTNQVILVQCTK